MSSSCSNSCNKVCVLLPTMKCRLAGWKFKKTACKFSKCPKISNTLFHTFLVQILLFMQLFPKIPCGMANSGDPDQTAPSWSTLSAYAILSDRWVYENLGHLPYSISSDKTLLMLLFSTKRYRYFLISPRKCMLLVCIVMSTYNVCFHAEIRKIITKAQLFTVLA